MKYGVRLLVFAVAFLIGNAAVLPPMPEIPELTDEVAAKNYCCLSDAAAVDDRIQRPTLTIELRRHDPEFEITERTINIDPAAKPFSTNIDSDLSESIENQIVAVHPIPDRGEEFKVEQQFENSMAIGDEGPHWDFVDWKHYTSPWRGLESVGTRQFLTRKLSEDDYTKFPRVSNKEIVRLLKKRGASKGWIEHARTCSTANSGPCYVSTSRISLRISIKEDNRWKVIHTINFSIPMGC